jgi:hypothetical protein
VRPGDGGGGVDGDDHRLAVVPLVDHHVAGQHHAHLQLRGERPEGELGVAGAQDAVAPEVDADLLLQRVLHVDLGEHAEALGLEHVGHPGERLVEGEVRLPLDPELGHVAPPLSGFKG